MSENSIYDVVVIGSGPAGYTAALYSSRAMLSTLIIGGSNSGGQLMQTNDIENFPGYSGEGPILMEKLKVQALSFGAEFKAQNVLSIVPAGDNIYHSVNTKTETIYCRSIIIATGAEAQWLNIEGEENFKGRGISTCATCDGYFFKNEEIVVVGGGDTAFEEAMYLTRYASKVTIIHRSNTYRASKIMYERAKANDKIFWEEYKTVSRWLSDVDGNITGSVLKDTITEQEQEINFAGAFIAIGHKPGTSFLNGSGVELDTEGYIVNKENTMTNVPGIFAAGDCADKIYRQAIFAAGMGCRAAIECTRFLSGH
jgi:thioredoxin reductase (NADPH)